MEKYGVGGCRGLPGGKGFGIGESAFCKMDSGRLACGPSRAPRARWPDLKATASAADPITAIVGIVGVDVVLVVVDVLVVLVVAGSPVG